MSEGSFNNQVPTRRADNRWLRRMGGPASIVFGFFCVACIGLLVAGVLVWSWSAVALALTIVSALLSGIVSLLSFINYRKHHSVNPVNDGDKKSEKRVKVAIPSKIRELKAAVERSMQRSLPKNPSLEVVSKTDGSVTMFFDCAPSDVPKFKSFSNKYLKNKKGSGFYFQAESATEHCPIRWAIEKGEIKSVTEDFNQFIKETEEERKMDPSVGPG